MLEIISKYPELLGDGSPKGTKVILKNDEDWTFPILLPTDYLEKSQSDIIAKCEDIIYQKLFPQRAENEKFAEFNKMIEKANSTIQKMEIQMIKQKDASGTAQASILELITLLYFKGVISDEDFTTITSES
ncbi:DUF1366 domain-containing protein [Streptococcus dysgalactiae subsp. equisimilis]|uniref:DUF1366 domain-containing protein n=1 Tax=Streptococcus dysgalactiae TaxID=1334 RepID=UPI00194FC89D|nr:DUF1366 domain-containing protein [Streptococcus dysgalactiae]MBM6533988.1 DUF1366 domain-containing protein [Streptococcus dysgalactiae subsp. equisimilis]